MYEDEHLRLKYRSLWLKAWDRNTSFFHRQCRARLSQNHISKISNDDRIIIKCQELLKQSANMHFQMLFQDDGFFYKEVSNDFLNNVPSLVNNQDNYDLMKPSSKTEIVDVIWAMDSDKAPRPDGFSIQVHEYIHSVFIRKEKGMIIKLDMKNAFDQVKLPFLYGVLLSFGFFLEFVNLIKACTNKPWIAPLVNGRPIDFFKATRGLRQGCLMSPFLCILMVESLNRKLLAEKEAGFLLGIMIARGVDPINHALFANDSLLLGRASLMIAQDFNVILQNFCQSSGALINKNKSAVYGWNVDQLALLRISDFFGFPSFVKWEKIKYLGLPLTLGSSPPSLWLDVLAKLKEKITSWGGQWLSKAGELILIKSVLSAFLVFQSTLLLALKSISFQVAKILRDFLWNGGLGGKNKMLFFYT